MTPDDLLCNELHGRVEDTVRQVRREVFNDVERRSAEAADRLWAIMTRGLTEDEADDLAIELLREVDTRSD